MIRDITVGQYYAADSCIHRLDPRVKIIGTMVFVIMLFVINDVPSYAFSILSLALRTIEGFLIFKSAISLKKAIV